jgi:hypothetical protein
LRTAPITTFTANHVHEDQRWMHAHKRRTFKAYHACLADFNKHFLLHILAFTCFSSSDTGFYLASAYQLQHTHTTRLALSSITKCLFHMISLIRLDELAFTARWKLQPDLPPNGFPQFQQRSFSWVVDFWRLPFSRKDIPPRPNLTLVFSLS